jgi:hypothetical protein
MSPDLLDDDDDDNDYDHDLLEGWFERAKERAEYSGRLICDELKSIGPDDRRFWRDMAYFLQRLDLHHDAADAWDKAIEVATNDDDIVKTLYEKAESFWRVHMNKGRSGQPTIYWELALEALQRIVWMGCGTTDTYQLLAYYNDDAGKEATTLEYVTQALDKSVTGDIEWEEIHDLEESYIDRQKIICIRDYGELTRALVDRRMYEAAGKAAEKAFSYGWWMTPPSEE